MNENKTNWELEDAVEVVLKNSDDFLKIKETLQRIGIPSYKEKKLYQTAHILHKRGKYYIIHFKCLFALDGKTAPFNQLDWMRQNRIAKLLEEWGLCSIITPEEIESKMDASNLKIIRFGEKDEWQLVPKYNIGT